MADSVDDLLIHVIFHGKLFNYQMVSDFGQALMLVCEEQDSQLIHYDHLPYFGYAVTQQKISANKGLNTATAWLVPPCSLSWLNPNQCFPKTTICYQT